ncbi:MAG TPA: HlyD family secretion protein [Caulobacteraceae bacterium]|jgi:membrane fusion protein (multidrug efflux system)|nr:HlyD family secretion protein [Caulobacteraceae bacterium]
MAALEQNGAGAGAAPARSQSLLRRLRWPLMAIAPIAIVAAAAVAYLNGGRYQSTDDAYVQAARVAISASTSGRVIEVLVHENEQVKRGQVLFRLDPRDYDAAIATARAKVAEARLQVRSTQASYEPRQAEVKAAQAELAYRLKELERQRQLTASEVGSRRELDERTNDVNVARSRLAAAQANLAQALATIGGSPKGPTDVNPSVQGAQAALDNLILDRGKTVVIAPQDGLVTKVEQLQVGSYINTAQPLFTLVAPRMWIDANFKEDQLNYMREGQKGEAEIDAYPGQKYPVHVESLSPGTGSAFSLLPAENATGNWVKVTQRLPVRVAFDHPEAIGTRLHAGLSVKVKIDTQHRRTLFGHVPPAPVPGPRP